MTDLRSMISLIALGLAFGLAGRCFSVLLQKAKKLFGEKISNPLIRIGVMAIPLAALLFVIHGGRYTGLGTNLISASFAGETIYGYDWILKLLFTVFTLALMTHFYISDFNEGTLCEKKYLPYCFIFSF